MVGGMMMSLAETIRSARLERGLTKNAVAESVGVSPAYWDKIEKGESIPTVDVAARIKKVMELPAEIFFQSSEALTSGEMDRALETQAKQLMGTRYNDDSIIDIKKLKYREKKVVLRFLKRVGENDVNAWGSTKQTKVRD
jgi:transcriptional regulator with XRE-family HTH domain